MILWGILAYIAFQLLVGLVVSRHIKIESVRISRWPVVVFGFLSCWLARHAEGVHDLGEEES